MTSTPLPRASSHQPNMGNVLADLRRASSSMFSSPGTKSSPANYGDGPPRVQHRHPDDESSPGASDNRSDADAPSLKPTQYGMQRMKLATPSPQSHTMNMHSINEGFNNLAKKTDERVQKAQTMEVGIFAKGEAEKLIAKDAVAADDATRKSLQDNRLVDEAAAAEEECAKEDMNQIQPPMLADSDHATLLDVLANTASHHGHRAVEEAEMQQQCLANEVGTSDSLLASGVLDSTDSDTRAPDPIKTRREMMLARRERARSRQPRLSSSPVRTVSSSVTGAATTPVPPATGASEHVIPDRGAEIHRPNSSVQASTASLARERYARHKKMLQQRRG